MHVQCQDRARGALYGLAIGDALGMPTQMLSRRQIVERWGPLLTGFEAAPDDHPIAAGMPAGAVTDDTEQAVLLGRLLVDGNGRVDPGELAAALLGWEREMAARGSLDLLGPSTKRALTAVQAGAPPTETGRYGDTNGAAMRITPVGIATAADPLPPWSTGCSRRASSPTTRPSRWRARPPSPPRSAPASTAPTSRPRPSTAIAAARLGAQRGHWTAGADVAARIDWAASLVAGAAPRRAAELIYTLVGTSLATQESVPGRVRRAQRGAGRPLAGVPAGRVAGRRLRHDRGDGGRDRRRLPWPGRVPAARDRDRGRERARTSPRWLTRSSNCENHDHPERTPCHPAGRP